MTYPGKLPRQVDEKELSVFRKMLPLSSAKEMMSQSMNNSGSPNTPSIIYDQQGLTERSAQVQELALSI
jgi:hypothetical protein